MGSGHHKHGGRTNTFACPSRSAAYASGLPVREDDLENNGTSTVPDQQPCVRYRRTPGFATTARIVNASKTM